MTFVRRKSVLRTLCIAVLMALFATACGGANPAETAIDPSAGETTETNAEPGLGVGLPETAATDDEGNIDLASVPQADPDLFISEEDEDGPVDPWKVFVLTARSDTGVVPVFTEPGGEEFDLQYEYLDGDKIDYPLVNPTYFGNALALAVVDGKPGEAWAEVMVPTRPHGTTAWVQTAFFEWSSHNYHIDVDVATNDVRVWKGDELIDQSPAVTGRPSAPTPVLTTFIDEKIPGPNEAYGSWILSLGAFSEDLLLFNDGLPKLALHGTNQPELVTAREYASAGCIRLPNEFIEMMAETVPVGAIVSITNSTAT